MKNYLIVFILFLSQGLFAQYIISGKIVDAQSGESLVGATIVQSGTLQGCTTNNYGYFSLNVSGKKQVLRCSFVGYNPVTLELNVVRDTIIVVQLQTDIVLSEVVVNASRKEQFLQGTDMGINRLSAREVETLPVVLGETDLIKALQTLPGVNAGSDGSAGFSVRGGSPDQTLILLDEVPVYNVNHLFGYFSVFNNDAIKDARLIKGAIPSQYGGRLSSVLDVQMKEGNQNEHSGKASVSTLSGKYTLEGPIVKGKSSYMLSGRKTWLDLPLRLFFYLTDSDMKVLYSFYDLNGKVNFELSKRDHLFVSFYGGRDRFYLGNDTDDYVFGNSSSKYEFYWGNTTASSRWNHIYGSRLFSNLTVYYSKYNYHHLYEFESSDSKQSIDTYSSLADISLKYDFDYFVDNRHQVKFGTKLSYLFFQPEKTDLDSTSLGLSNHYQAPVLDLYINDEWKVSENIQMNVGLRQSVLKRGDAFNLHLLPSIAIRYSINEYSSIKVGYSRMVQHLHQLTNPSLSLPTTMWVLSNASLQSSLSNLSSVGYYFLHRNGLEFSVEGYYNTMNHVIDYLPGKENFKIDESQWNESVMVGCGRAYGIEFMAQYQFGDYSGRISYTWSRSLHNYEALEYVGWYPYAYDRPNNISLQLTKTFEGRDEAKFNKRLSFSFNCMSGHLLSFSNFTQPSIFPNELDGYSSSLNDYNFFIPNPNNVRLPAVHHLDVAFHLDNKSKEKSSWIFSIYNIYNRKNISFYFIDSNDNLKGATLLPIIPSVTWNYKF